MPIVPSSSQSQALKPHHRDLLPLQRLMLLSLGLETRERCSLVRFVLFCAIEYCSQPARRWQQRTSPAHSQGIYSSYSSQSYHLRVLMRCLPLLFPSRCENAAEDFLAHHITAQHLGRISSSSSSRTSCPVANHGAALLPSHSGTV